VVIMLFVYKKSWQLCVSIIKEPYMNSCIVDNKAIYQACDLHLSERSTSIYLPRFITVEVQKRIILHIYDCFIISRVFSVCVGLLSTLSTEIKTCKPLVAVSRVCC